ncbi:MAG: FAD-dependent oxidoreductase, partial [Spirochaetota bacterium]
MVVVIVGSGIASKSALEVLLKDLENQDQIIIISKDQNFFYSRVLLPLYMAGELKREELIFAQSEIINHERVTLISDTVLNIDTENKSIYLKKSDPVFYDKLILASGASPTRMKVRNSDSGGIYYLRDFEDAEAIREHAREAGHCTVVGGGLISLKTAWALKKLGRDVTLLVSSAQLLSRAADGFVSEIIQRAFQAHGVAVRLHSDVAE